MKFLNKTHEDRYNILIKRGIGVRPGDMERIPAMYILAGNDGLYSKVDKIYDFKNGYFDLEIKVICEECEKMKVDWKVEMSTSEERLASLAFDIFSGRSFIGVCNLFRALDINNVQLALNAIKLKYQY